MGPHGPLQLLGAALVLLGSIGIAAALGQWLEHRLGEVVPQPGASLTRLVTVSGLLVVLGASLYAVASVAR